jgi:serine/threonine protein kinase
MSDIQPSPRRPSTTHVMSSVGRMCRPQRSEEFRFDPGLVIPGTRYRLVRWLGDGGMGVVYEAEHVDIERRVAVKVLRLEVCQQPQALQLFRDEARAAGRIGSAHIVEILDFAELPTGACSTRWSCSAGAPCPAS